MNKMLFAMVAVASTAAFAGMPDITADASGYYDVTLTTKRLTHAEKTVTKTFTTSTKKGETTYAWDLFVDHYNSVKDLLGFNEVSVTADGVVYDIAKGETTAKKIVFKYTYYSFTTADKGATTNYTTKVVTESNRGVYDAETGKVYLWNTASKVSGVTDEGKGSIVGEDEKKAQSGYVAYEVPLAMHNQFVASDDNKAAGGFVGGINKAEDGTVLDFDGLVAFGTGTAKAGELNTVAGNVALKDPDNKHIGSYGTWRVAKDSAKKDQGVDIGTVLRNKGCVELFLETEH